MFNLKYCAAKKQKHAHTKDGWQVWEQKKRFCEGKEEDTHVEDQSALFSSCLGFIFLSFSSLALAGFIQPQNSIHALCLTLVY